jgi:pectate lyase
MSATPVTSPTPASGETGVPPLPLEGPSAPGPGADPSGTNPPVAGPPPAALDPPQPAAEPAEPADPETEVPLDPDLTLIGWAAVAGLGTSTTTGGAAGQTVTATTAEELADFASRPEPLTILVAGTLRLARVQVASDKTLRGVGPSPRIEGGLRIRGREDDFVRNVIVQNLTILASFSDVEGDGIQIHYAHHVWVDHCDVQDAPDGNLDIVHGSDFVTVSFSRFSYGPAASSERLSTQIGHSDSASASEEDTGHLRVTLHHDFWDAGVVGSMPSARFGDVHVFNNYYASADAETAITAALGSRLLVEDNYFESVPTPFRIDGGTAPEPELRAVANVVPAGAATLEAGNAFVPPYEYVPDAADGVPARVRSAAGATLSFAVPVP